MQSLRTRAPQLGVPYALQDRERVPEFAFHLASAVSLCFGLISGVSLCRSPAQGQALGSMRTPGDEHFLPQLETLTATDSAHAGLEERLAVSRDLPVDESMTGPWTSSPAASRAQGGVGVRMWNLPGHRTVPSDENVSGELPPPPAGHPGPRGGSVCCDHPRVGLGAK